MKKKITLGIFLMLIFMVPGLLQARASGGEAMALPEVTTYEELRHAISQARAESRVRVEKAVEQERVREAWEIGRLIDAHVLQHKERADYGEQVLLKLAKDLGMSETELGYMLQFARAYPISPSTGQLSWGHYRELLSLNDPQQRKSVADEAFKNKWNQKEIRDAIRKAKSETGEKGSVTFSPKWSQIPKPGKPGIYRVILAKAGPYTDELAIDLGFSNYVRLAEVVEDASQFKEGDIIVSSKDTKGHYSLSPCPRPGLGHGEEPVGSAPCTPDDLFTYEAYVYKVLDGDTVTVVVDLGFGFTTTQTLRLRGIDAPEIQTRDGMESKEFVESVLASPVGAKQSILIRTVKSDKYDRYLADVFLLDAKGQEAYLNNLLLEKGLAVRVRE